MDKYQIVNKLNQAQYSKFLETVSPIQGYNIKICKHIISLLILIISMSASAFADRLKDLTSLVGVRSNQLAGYGVVVGLAGTGDGNTGLKLQVMQSLASRYVVTSEVEGLNGDNAAAVMITADLPPFPKMGQGIDVTVSTIGGAESLKGGTLLMAPLLGADGETYAIAQGNILVGGLGVTGADNSSLTVNIPTVGRIPRGASVERTVPTELLINDFVFLSLTQEDFVAVNNAVEAINQYFGPKTAILLSYSSIRVRAPADPAQKVAFLSLVEQIVPAELLINDFVFPYFDDFVAVNNAAEAINQYFGPETAIVLSHNSIQVRAPADPAQKVAFVALLENLFKGE